MSICEYLTWGNISKRISTIDKMGDHLKFSVSSNNLDALADKLKLSKNKLSIELNE